MNEVNVGIPYDWENASTLEDFENGLKAGKFAGNVLDDKKDTAALSCFSKNLQMPRNQKQLSLMPQEAQERYLKEKRMQPSYLKKATIAKTKLSKAEQEKRPKMIDNKVAR